MRNIKLVSILFLAGMLVLPLVTSAATMEELQTQLNALLKQVSALQEQIKQQRGGTSTGVPVTGSGETPTSAIVPDDGNRWCYNFNRSLKVGTKGDDVAALQTTLEQEGINISENEKTQGVFGASTAAAVEKFQEKNKTTIAGYSDPSARGIFGPQTRNLIGRTYGCGTGKIPTTPIPGICAQEGESLKNPSLGPNVAENNRKPIVCCGGLKPVVPGSESGQSIVGAAAVCIKLPIQTCGGIAGKTCSTGFTCKLDGTYPDAGGTCVKTPTRICPMLSEQELQCKVGEKIEYVKDDGGCFVSKRCVSSTTPTCKKYEPIYCTTTVVPGGKDANGCTLPSTCAPRIEVFQPCGGIAGKLCAAGLTCRLDGTSSDAVGVCVKVPTDITKPICPMIAYPGPDYCKGGILVQNKEVGGCAVPPTCVYSTNTSTSTGTIPASTTSSY